MFMTIEDFMKTHDLNEETWVVDEGECYAFYPYPYYTYYFNKKRLELVGFTEEDPLDYDHFPEKWWPDNAVKYKDLIIN